MYWQGSWLEPRARRPGRGVFLTAHISCHRRACPGGLAQGEDLHPHDSLVSGLNLNFTIGFGHRQHRARHLLNLDRIMQERRNDELGIGPPPVASATRVATSRR